jgi:predicted Mrr-cat superfamily restriction endonuclease
MNKKSKLDLIKKMKEITASGLPFMEGKEKVELDEGLLYVVKDYGYLESEDGEFVVIADDTTFAFGGSVITETFKKLDESMSKEDIAELLAYGIEMLIKKKKSKNKRDYTVCEFFPE